jgi:arylsulfatase A
VFHLPQRVHPHSSMRAGDYKLFVYWKDKNWAVRKVALYDLSKDIGEKNDISGQQPGKAKELVAALTAYLQAANAEAPFIARLQQSDDR